MASRTTRSITRRAHESPMVILIPLTFLAIGRSSPAIPFPNAFAGHGVAEFFRESLGRSGPTTNSSTRCMTSSSVA